MSYLCLYKIYVAYVRCVNFLRVSLPLPVSPSSLHSLMQSGCSGVKFRDCRHRCYRWSTLPNEVQNVNLYERVRGISNKKYQTQRSFCFIQFHPVSSCSILFHPVLSCSIFCCVLCAVRCVMPVKIILTMSINFNFIACPLTATSAL